MFKGGIITSCEGHMCWSRKVHSRAISFIVSVTYDVITCDGHVGSTLVSVRYGVNLCGGHVRCHHCEEHVRGYYL